MTNETKIIVGVMVVTIALLVGGIFFLNKPGPTSNTPLIADQAVNIDYTKGQKVGPDDAKVKLVEFGDFQCPACASAEPTVNAILDTKYPNFQFIFRYFPLPQHQNAKASANFAAYAATQGKFWDLGPRLFATQTTWETQTDPTAFFDQLADELQLDKNGANDAIKNQTFKDVIEADLNEGNAIGVNSTPTFFLNGKQLNIKNFSQIKDLIEQELKK